MLERIVRGIVPAAPHTQNRGADGRLQYEHCLTRRGFDGPYTICYHQRRPHEALPAASEPLAAAAKLQAPRRLLRRHYRALPSPEISALPRGRALLLGNRDLKIYVAAPRESDDGYVVNADGDELYYVQSGQGVVRSLLGDLQFEAGDYVYVPRGLLHRLVLESGASSHFLLMEFSAPLALPAAYRNSVGQLRMDAPYSHRDFRKPELSAVRDEGIRRLLVQSAAQWHAYDLPASPLDVTGWDGTLYPFAFATSAFKPKVGRVHLPPSVHATFEAKGALVCSFVPRPLDFDPLAIPCPYPHSSVDIDEVIFYSRGQFASRRGVGPGSISHHPRGIPHGPHPGAYEGSLGALRTDELAVMVDCEQPLEVSAQAEALEDPHYHGSFVEPGSSHSTG